MIERSGTIILVCTTILFFVASTLGELGRITRYHAFLTESASLGIAGAALYILSHRIEGRRGVFCRIVGVVVAIFGMTMTFAVLNGMRAWA